jgi:hypothetical protein
LLFVIGIMIWVAAFGSHKECGPSLHTFSIVLMVIKILLFITILGMAKRQKAIINCFMDDDPSVQNGNFSRILLVPDGVSGDFWNKKNKFLCIFSFRMELRVESIVREDLWSKAQSASIAMPLLPSRHF